MSRVVVAANSTWNLQNFRKGILRGLADQGHEIVTISPDAHGVDLGGTTIRHRMCKMVRSGMNPVQDLAYFLRLLRVLRDEAPDVFFGFTIKPNIYGCLACRILGIRAAPNVSGLGTAFLGHSRLRRAVLIMYRFAFKRACPVFFQNKDDRALFVEERVVPVEKTEVLPGSGVDLAHFSPTDVPTSLTFIMIARLLGDKGVREYVDAARNFKAKNHGSTFWLLGELDHENRTAIGPDELQAWIREGTIDYLGSSSDVRPFIQQAAAVVLPSYREGLARSLLEGAAMARPLIATNVPGCREVVREGETGFLCDPMSADSLATAFTRFSVMSHLKRVKMGERAREMVERDYGEGRVVRAYLDVLGTHCPAFRKPWGGRRNG